MVTAGFWEGVLMPNLAALLYLGPGFLFNSPGLRRLAIGGGSGNLVFRRALAESGGFRLLCNRVIDDVALARQIKSSGFGVRAFTACDEVRVRMYEGLREVADGFTKNVAYLFRSSALVLALDSLLHRSRMGSLCRAAVRRGRFREGRRGGLDRRDPRGPAGRRAHFANSGLERALPPPHGDGVGGDRRSVRASPDRLAKRRLERAVHARGRGPVTRLKPRE